MDPAREYLLDTRRSKRPKTNEPFNSPREPPPPSNCSSSHFTLCLSSPNLWVEEWFKDEGRKQDNDLTLGVQLLDARGHLATERTVPLAVTLHYAATRELVARQEILKLGEPSRPDRAHPKYTLLTRPTLTSRPTLLQSTRSA